MQFYCPDPLSSQDLHPLFYFRYTGTTQAGGIFKEHLPPNFFESASYTESTDEADAIVLPNNFRWLDTETKNYIVRYADEAERNNIPLFLFSHADFSHELQFDPRAYVFRLSAYRSELTSRDIITPTPTEDLGSNGISIRLKKEKPTVSFCGQAGYKTTSQWLRYRVKVTASWIGSFFSPHLYPRMLGVYWRRKALRACSRSSLVETRFIIRNSFSGALRTIEVPPDLARREFIDSIVESDMVLAPKGDGNYSNRFLEALSLGRIPVLIDTDTPLPLEHEIPYDEFIIRVPMHKIELTPRYIRAWYDALSNENYAKRQRQAREIYEIYLRQDSFFKYFFAEVLPKIKSQP